MKQEDLMLSMRMRLLKAIALVIAILVAVPGIDAVARVASASRAADASGVGIDIGALMGAGDAYAALDEIEDAIEPDEADVPDGFADEVGFLPGARSVRASDGGAVVGYVVDGAADDVMGQLTAQMEGKGWTAVPLGEVEGATFMKSGGAFTWVLVTCTQAGSSTSVVARCMAE